MLDLNLSLLFFAGHGGDGQAKYDEFVKLVQIADAAGLEAVWIPERHFDPFGGLFPNPAVLGAAVAMITDRIRIRAGSVVMPIQDPLRVAEEWAVVDNLSNGRVDLGVAQGWNPSDFSLVPENYGRRLESMYKGLDDVHALWRGEAVQRTNGKGDIRPITTYPRPVQKALATWMTCVGSEERFKEAGEKGLNVLTALLLQGHAELERNIEVYREARRKAGYEESTGVVSLMMHTYIGPSADEVFDAVAEPLRYFIKSSFPLWRQRFEDLNELSDTKREMLWEYAFQKYYHTCGLFGSPDQAKQRLDEVKQLGVDEVACLVDFGAEQSMVLEGVRKLGELLR